jgi:hypothetical protein
MNTKQFIALFICVFFSIVSCSIKKMTSSSKPLSDKDNLIFVIQKIQNGLCKNDTLNVLFLKNPTDPMGRYILAGIQDTMIVETSYDFKSKIEFIKIDILHDTVENFKRFLKGVSTTNYHEIPEVYIDEKCNGCSMVVHFECVIKNRKIKVMRESMLLGPFLLL